MVFQRIFNVGTKKLDNNFLRFQEKDYIGTFSWQFGVKMYLKLFEQELLFSRNESNQFPTFGLLWSLQLIADIILYRETATVSVVSSGL